MRLLTIADIPEQVYFWRENHPRRWIKLHGLTISAFPDDLNSGETLVNAEPEEIILSDPNWCSDCWRQPSFWPPLGPCTFCGSASMPSTLEEAKRRVSELTGLRDPHV